MPWPSKRKQQLGNARDTKRQKQQPENPREDQQGRETQDDVLDGGDREPDPDCSDENGENLGPDGFIADGADPELESDSAENDEEFPEVEDDREVPDVNELIKDYAREWVNGLDRDDLRSLSVLMHYLLVCRLQIGATDASKCIVEVVGKCERTIRDWRATFIANQGSFPDTMQGRYQRTGVLWHNEELSELATNYVRENRVVKGKPNLNLQSFTVWVNTVLLPNHALDPGFPRKISCETARKWLHELGFSVIDVKKGTYVDGHERSDVVEYRAQFLRKMIAMGFLNRENAPTPEAKLALPEDLDAPQADILAKTIVLFHDESTFQANDYERTQWGTNSDHMLVPKSRGAGIMISDFISEEDGYLSLTDEEFAAGRSKYPRLKQFARSSIEYGENRDGYWTSERFLEQLKYSVQIVECKYPCEQGYKVIWIFDHSSCHGAYADDALLANRMNAKPGGKQAKLRDTVWDGKIQRMVFNVGVPKGLIQVLKERGKYRNGMKLDEMRAEILTHPDFKNEKTKIEHFLNGKGYGCVFLPKFHCELNPIERCWGQAKRYTRAHCKYTIAGLRKNVPHGLDCVTVDNIRNYFRKSRHYMFGYLQGVAGGPQLEELVLKMKKNYKSHRKVGVDE